MNHRAVQWESLAGMRWLALMASCAVISGAHASGNQLPDDAITVFGITAGSNQTLSDVAARLGPAKPWHTGDAAGSEWRLCYRLGPGSEETVVEFASNSEMSSAKGQVNVIRIYGPQMPFGAKRRCAAVPIAPSDVRTSNGIHLAATRSDIAAILWPRPLSRNNSLHYESCRKRYLGESDPQFKHWTGKADCGFENPKRPYENDCSSVEVQFKNGSASFLELSRGQSIC